MGPVLTQLFFPKPPTTFSHVSAEVRGENTPERKVASSGDRTRNHQVMNPTRSPLSHPGRTADTGFGTYFIVKVFNTVSFMYNNIYKWHKRHGSTCT